MMALRISTSAARCFLATLALCLMAGNSVAQIGGESPRATEDRERCIQNLRAFSKLYGYVRFFHPSDEAAIVDWDALAVYGAHRVKTARTTAELEEVLKEVFGPIAPTVQIFSTEDQAAPIAALEPNDTSGLHVVAWQYSGFPGTSASIYQAKRTHRPSNPPIAGQCHIIQRIDVGDFQGSTLTLRVHARTPSESKTRAAYSQIQYRSADGTVLRDGTPPTQITSGEWTRYEVQGEVPENAATLEIMLSLYGEGAIAVDDVEVVVSDGTSDSSVAIDNPGFDSGLDGWSVDADGFEVRSDAELARSGTACLSVQSRPEGKIGPLFDEYPKPGEVHEAQLMPELRCRVPLALWSNEEHTLGPERPPLAPLIEALDAIDTTDAENEDVVLGGVIVAWNVLQHFYPYFDVVDVDWDQELPRALDRAMKARTAEDYEDVIALLVAALQDGHGSVHSPRDWGTTGFLPWRLANIDNTLVVTASRVDSLKPGDIVISIDGEDALKRFAHDVSRRSGTLRWRQAITLADFGEGAIDTPVAIVVDRDGAIVEVSVTRGPPTEIEVFTREAIEEIEPGIWYISLDKAPMPGISMLLEKLASAKGIIFDLRRYPAANHELIAHLIPEADEHKWMFIARIVYPDHRKIVGWDGYGWPTTPTQPQISAKMVFITSARAISYAESWLGFVECHHLGEIVGETTAGANGNVTDFDIPGGMRVRFTGMKVLKHDGSQHHGIGIVATVPVSQTLEGIRSGRDEYFDAALKLVREVSQ